MFKGISFIVSAFFISGLYASPKTICGVDDRVLSFEPQVGRLSQLGKYKGCTATMISDSCAISAGHCLEVLDVVEFNTLPSSNYEPVPSRSEDLYEIDKSSIVSTYERIGNDFAVFKVKPNRITKKLPGVVQGHYEVSFSAPSKGDKIRITGYGVDESKADGNFAQQTHSGKITSIGNIFSGANSLSYDVDTMGGNSGSSIILQNTNKIIGIHTNGGCSSYGGSNKGTLIATHAKLKAAIKACLNSDR